MKIILLVLGMMILTSCSTTHNHYHNPNDDIYVQEEVMHHSYHDYGDHIVVVVKHRHRLNKGQRHKIKRWCHRHYGHHRKRIRCQFILG